MRVFVAGASGAIGRFVVPALIEAGHQVVGASRSQQGVDRLHAQGAEGVRLDVFDRAAVLSAVAAAAPDAVMHQLTALSNGSSADNARIRKVGTRNLVDAAKGAGVDRIVAQSISWAYEPGDTPAEENTPLDVAAPEPRSVTIGGIVALEEAVREIENHVILRYGTLYGQGTWYAPGQLIAKQLSAGEFTATDGVSSFVHVADAARAAVLALDWPSGVVNIVDDEPAPGREWARVLAEALGVPAPEPTPGGAGWERGANNGLARTSRDWQPQYPSWRTGFFAAARA
jgi:nucleoside-diphosphate-sugar epimerase